LAALAAALAAAAAPAAAEVAIVGEAEKRDWSGQLGRQAKEDFCI